MDLKMIVATHKPYRMPEDSIYLPVHAGHKGKAGIGYIGDDYGESISDKNPNYCELSTLYWAWKNLDADAIGLVHYRRHFSKRGIIGYHLFGKWNSILSKEQTEKILDQYGVIVPNKRRYWIETNYSHYIHAHHKEGLDLAGKIITEYYPEYLDSFKLVMRRRWAHMFNMLIMKKEYFDSYCTWLFEILSKLESQLDISNYSISEARVFGYVSELLLDVWIHKNGLTYFEVNAMFMEKQNWILKGGKFLLRKINGRLTRLQ